VHRFFVSLEQIEGSQVIFPRDISHQLVRVLRLKVRDNLVVLDNLGNEYLVQLTDMHPERCRAAVLDVTRHMEFTKVIVFLFISLTHRDKFEWILQKATEIGVSQFFPVITSRTLVQSDDQWVKKSERMERIIREAAEQSGSIKLPSLQNPLPYQDSLNLAGKLSDISIILWENENHQRMKEYLRGLRFSGVPAKVAVFIGPEGGYSEIEIDQAISAGIQPVTIGRKILRMETAAILAAGMVFYELG
jgi:16S rRNA (uracil1498-N3)-methyltransferase